MRWAIAKYRSLHARFEATARHLRADERGVSGIVTALAAAVLMGFAGLAVDVVMWQVNQRSMQGAADQAALGAATAYRNAGETTALGANATAVNAAYATAIQSGYPASSITVAPYTGGLNCTGTGVNAGCLKVTITQAQERYFTGIFLTQDPIVSVSAVGTCTGCGSGNPIVGSNGGDPCVMALDANGSGIGTDIKGDVSLSGGAIVSVNKCNLYNNSPYTDATVVNNNSKIEGCDSSIISSSCSSKMFLAQSNDPNGGCVPGATTSCPIDIPVVTKAAPAPDPYANLAPPTVASTCTDFSAYETAKNSGVFQNVPSGTYCPGSITGAQITFKDNAVIVFNGGLDLHSGTSSLTGSGVAIYVQSDGTSSQASTINATTQVNITAPTTGVYQGVALWFGGASNVSYSGSNGTGFQGAIYAPTANVSYAGNAGSTSTCTRLVAGSVTFTGGATANFDNSTCPVVAGAVLTASGVTGSTTYSGQPMLVQ